MDASILYLTKHLCDGDRMAIFVGDDLSAVVKDAINVYDLDLTVEEVLNRIEEEDYGTGPFQFGSWSFEVGYLGDKSNLVLKMSEVDYTDDWRGEDGDC